MQHKRMKRLLGNAFYLNVRYNQGDARAHKNNSGLSNLKKYNKTESWEKFDIKEGEALYSVPDSKNTRRSNHAHVLSSLNGALQGDDEEKLYDFLFEGIAQTEHNASNQLQVDQGLVSCVSGVITIMNDHAKHISPGELLYMTVPNNTKPHRGIDRDKMRFCLAPMTDTEIAELYYDKWIDTDKSEDAAREVFKYSHIDKRQVAKALSQAKHGEKLDILLYPRLTT